MQACPRMNREAKWHCVVQYVCTNKENLVFRIQLVSEDLVKTSIPKPHFQFGRAPCSWSLCRFVIIIVPHAEAACAAEVAAAAAA